jgi:hypothetical protein
MKCSNCLEEMPLGDQDGVVVQVAADQSFIAAVCGRCTDMATVIKVVLRRGKEGYEYDQFLPVEPRGAAS